MQIEVEITFPERENGKVARKLRSLVAFGLLCGTSLTAQDHPASDSFAGKIGRTAADSIPDPLIEPTAPEGSPNVVYIVLDDAGFGDIGCYGSLVSTPYMDSLAATGLQFNNFHSKSVCSPTRASLLTGRNAHSVGMKELPGNDQGYPHTRGRVTAAAANIAQILQRNGFHTMATGKWHLVPKTELSDTGDRTHWPLQKGFDRFHGFLSGWSDQYRPDLVIDNRNVDPPEDPDYHFSEDIVSQAINSIGTILVERSDEPFFHYLTFGAVHSPIQVPKRYIAKYTGMFDDGWDAVRERRFRKQLEIGLIPADSKLPPRNPGDPAWTDLSEVEQAVFARFMEAYSGYLEHTDDQIGRLVEFLKERGIFDNTLVVLISDNGGAPEAGIGGNFEHPYSGKLTVEQMYERLDDLGSRASQPQYQRGWAMASCAPFKYYKLWPFNGGVRTPMIVSWPDGIQSPGLREQFVDVIDITPTVLDILGIDVPEYFDGVAQMPLQGASLRSVFESSTAPAPRDTQFFELWGSRSIYHQGWKAVAFHQDGTDFDDDHWELYYQPDDFTETVDLAAKHPGKLKELQQIWWSEAAKNGALPLLEAQGGRKRSYDQIFIENSL
jgi:arylsulfatase A-like enzyme